MFIPRHFPALLIPLLLAAFACGGEPEGGLEISLLDDAHAPDVLTESRALTFPPGIESNRFLRGWRLRRQGSNRTVAPQPRNSGSSLEIVNLGSRSRNLVLRSNFADLPQDAVVEVGVAGHDLGPFPLQNPLVIPLPAGLPLGRVSIALRFPETGTIQVRSAAFKSAAAAGTAQFDHGEVRQAGTSLVDLVRSLETPTVLRMRFTPPRQPKEGQRFALLVETENEGTDVVFEWRPSFWSRLRGTRDFELAFPASTGLVRFRLLAEGQGPPATWRPQLYFPEIPETPIDQPPAPPRLVLLYVLDALRADHMGHLVGRKDLSPNFDRVAAEGATFTEHLSVAPNTLPSSMSLFTGQIFLDLPQGRWNLAPDGPETLAEVFRNAGFETAVFSANGFLSKTFGTIRGFDFDGRSSIYDPEFVTGPYNDSAERVHRATLNWLDQRDPEQSAFLYLHSLNPHNPYNPPEPFLSRFTDGPASIDGETKTLNAIKQSRREVNVEEQKRLLDLYAAGMAYNDFHFASFLSEIEKRFEPGEVLLIVTSDHGDEFFEHGGILHGYTLYKEQLAIPLIFRWPGQIPPSRLSAATDNLDLHETLRSLVNAPHSQRGSGRSLWPLLADAQTSESGKTVRFAAASGVKGGMYMARSKGAKLIWAPRGGGRWGLGEGRGRSRDPEYFFDLVQDPQEMVNRIDEPSLEAAWLRSRLLAWLETTRAIETGTTEDSGELDEETRKHLKALGYLD